MHVIGQIPALLTLFDFSSSFQHTFANSRAFGQHFIESLCEDPCFRVSHRPIGAYKLRNSASQKCLGDARVVFVLVTCGGVSASDACTFAGVEETERWQLVQLSKVVAGEDGRTAGRRSPGTD